MAVKRSGVAFLFALAAFVGAYGAASRLGYLDRLQARFTGRSPAGTRLTTGDFPAGVAAPVGELASVPLRTTTIGFVPRGHSAALLLAAGDQDEPGLFRTAYALDARTVMFTRHEDLRRAFETGGEAGGVDFAVFPVDRLAHWSRSLRDAAPRTLLLVGRSRGQEALAGVNTTLEGLKGKRIATCSGSSSHYFALWALARAGLSREDVRWVELASDFDAGAALREGRADAVAGLYADVEAAAKERGGKVLATTADAPHLVASVLVVRGEFAARYPDAVRRVLRGCLDASAAVQKDPLPAARLLGEVAPHLGDPTEALSRAPPATLKENLAFFGLSGEAPVTYDELFASATTLAQKLGQLSVAPKPEDSRDLAPLKFVATTSRP